MWKPSATSSSKFGQKWSHHMMPTKVLVLKAQGRHVLWSFFAIVWPSFGRKRSHHVMDAACRVGDYINLGVVLCEIFRAMFSLGTLCFSDKQKEKGFKFQENFRAAFSKKIRNSKHLSCQLRSADVPPHSYDGPPSHIGHTLQYRDLDAAWCLWLRVRGVEAYSGVHALPPRCLDTVAVADAIGSEALAEFVREHCILKQRINEKQRPTTLSLCREHQELNNRNMTNSFKKTIMMWDIAFLASKKIAIAIASFFKSQI